MTVLDIEIDGSPALAADLLGEANSVAPGKTVDLGDGIALEFRGSVPVRDFGANEILALALSFPVGVASAVVAERLLDRLKGTGHRITVITCGGFKLHLGDWLQFERTFSKVVEANTSQDKTADGGKSIE